LAKTYEGMGYEQILIKKHVDAFLSSVENGKKWGRYVNQFGLH
jgi:hypothetical protein